MGLIRSCARLSPNVSRAALAWIVLTSSGLGEDGSAVPAPSPTFISAYRMLVRSPQPSSSTIDESVLFSPDGKAVAWARVEAKFNQKGEQFSSSTVISICRPKDGSPIGRIELADSRGCPIAYSPDGRTLAAGLGSEVKLYDSLTHREQACLRGDDRASFEKMAFSVDGRRLAAASYDSVSVWDLPSAKVIGVIDARTGFVHGIAFSPEGTTLATAGEGPSLSASVGMSDRRPLGSNGLGGQIGLWKLDGSELGPSFEYPQPAYDVAFSPDGRTLAIAGGDGVRLWQVGGVDQPKRIAATPVHCLAYSVDGRYLALGTEEFSFVEGPAEVRVWDAEAGRDHLVLQAPMTHVRSVAVAPEGRSIVAAAREGVFLWDLPVPSPGRATTVAGSVNSPANGHASNVGRPAMGTPRQRSWTDGDTLLMIALTSLIGLAAPVLLVKGWWAAALVYRAREECRWLLESWLERDGFRLIRYRMIIIPLCYVVTVEDSRGRELKGWAEISGRFWSTPEYVPVRVDYFLFRKRSRKLKPPLTPQRIALWDEWLDRQSQA